jgi:hypothetical protein
MGQDDKQQPLPKQDTSNENQQNASAERDKPEEPPTITDYASI